MASSGGTRPGRLVTACPHCGKRFAVGAAFVGRQARCLGCGEPFAVQPAAPPPAAKTVARRKDTPTCGICQCPVAAGEPLRGCPQCRAPYHAECWDYNQGCALYGCPQAPPTEGLTALEIPPSHWGREEKRCPHCGNQINAAAVRCRTCGATFSSAAPQHAADYHVQRQIEAELPRLRTAAIWLLTFSLIPCTAPLAGVVGLLWYLFQRPAIHRLPPVFTALWMIALGAAAVQTVLLAFLGLVARLAGY